MPLGNGLDLPNPLGSDEPSSLRERLEPALQSKSHAFEQASMNHIGKWMPIENAVKIRRESQAAVDLSQASEEDFGVSHLPARRQILWITCVANDRAGCDPAQQKGRGRETRGADDDVGLRAE